MPHPGDAWRHNTMVEVVTVLETRWSDGIQWVKVECASGVRHWQFHEWSMWAANSRLIERDGKKVEGDDE